MRLREVQKRSRGPARLRLDDGRELSVPRGVLSRLDLVEGEDYDLQDLRERIDETTREVLRERARRYLARYRKTSREYVRHFQSRGFPVERVESLIPTLREEGFLDDESTAREHVRKRLRSKNYGRRKIIAELREKGLDQGEATEVVDEVYPREREQDVARDYCEEHADLPPRKLASRLDSRGFPGFLIGDLVDEYAGN